MDELSYIGNADPSAIDYLYKEFKKDPESVDLGWKKFFEGFEFAYANYEESGDVPENFQKEFKVINLINGYRSRGHLFTKTNPVRERRQYSPDLNIQNFGLSKDDLSTVFQAGEQVNIGPASLQEIIDHLELTYCQSIGIEFMYMRRPDRVEWFRNKIEIKNRPVFNKDRKRKLYEILVKAHGFESFLGKKFVGQKRFSIEGGESLIPALDALVIKGSELGVEDFVMGMAHRGRLNTLTNIFKKRPKDIFSEFEGKEFDFETTFDGDVKYHQGFTSQVELDNGKKVGMTLSPNPSHLEAVNAVVEGIAIA
jgi:2-oxoglutarate dehydrogenase E1 component